jgi:hypothetical protein
MLRRIRSRWAQLTFAIFFVGSFTSGLRAENGIEKAGVVVGITVGNMVVIPAKAISTSIGLFFGALSFVLTGGDTEVTHQMWRYSTADPYLITPDLARKAIGERPELLEKAP